MMKADILPFIREETVRRVLWEASIKWTLVQRKEILTKTDLKLSLKFAQKIFCKLFASSWEDDVECYLGVASFTHKRNPFD